MEFLIIGGVVLATAVLIALAFSNRIALRKYDIASKKLKGKITAVHLSDLHECLFGVGQSDIITKAKAASPDIILITGDMVEDGKNDPAVSKVLTDSNPAKQLFTALCDIAPTFMVLGNHESNIPNTHMLCAEIEALGVRLLHRRNKDDPDMAETVEIGGNQVLICGADDPYFDRVDPICRKKTIAERLSEDKDTHGHGKDIWRQRLRMEYANIAKDTRLTLLLSHRPEEYELYQELGFDAAFSGHAHGGQWRLPPFINGVYAPNQGIFPRHAGGCYRYGGFTHVVSRGLSVKRMVRIFNPPEICVVTFTGQ